ncbi:MAG TPA: HEAT repeat domain-containing protein [Candidatus Bilamarchaeum sp.]|nr:HEAT repeat domain-containing protein [Candidatus Bilamarchaeum sp.]
MASRQIPKRASFEQDARKALVDELRSGDLNARMRAMGVLFDYFERTLSPSPIDMRAFPLLRISRREHAVEGRPQSELDLRAFPVLRYQQRMEALRSFTPQLIDRLSDSDAQVRTSAAYLLGQVGARDALPLLRAISKSDPDPQVRAMAVSAVESIGPAPGR